jgi:hypothetical protein
VDFLDSVKHGLGDSWQDIFDRPFLVKETNAITRDTGFTVSGKPLIGQQTVHYGTGQGMGAYTS